MEIHFLLQYVHKIVHFIELHPHYGLFFAFLISFAESLPIVGTVIPGSITMTAVGTMIGSRILPGIPTILWASMGAFLGDFIGYVAGLYFQDGAHNIWPFKKYPKWLNFGEKFFQKHGGKSIIIGRFFGPMRSMVPMVAGILKMPLFRFIFAAIPTAIMWALLYTIPGMLLGALSLELPPGVATKFILIVLGLLIAIWLIFWLIKWLCSLFCRFCDRLSFHSWHFLNRKKRIKTLVHFIACRHAKHDHKQLTLIFYMLLCAIAFCILFISVITQGFLTGANLPVFHLLQSARPTWLYNAAIIVTILGNKVVIGAITICLLAWLAFRQKWRAFFYLLAVMFLTSGGIGFFKLIFHASRPVGIMHVAHSSSFPSGHSALSAALFGAIAFLSAQSERIIYQKLPFIIAALFALLIGMSRLFLGAHWLTDILGSYTLALSVLCFCTLFYRRHQSVPLPLFSWLKVVLISLALCEIVGCFLSFNAYQVDYQHRKIEQTIETNAWWKNPTKYLPIYRHNRFGHVIAPLNIQWNAPLDTIEKQLAQNSWKKLNPKTNLSNLLNRFKSHQPRYHLNFFAPLHQYQKPALVMIKSLHDTKTILEIKLWQSCVHLTDNKNPLWIGTINYHLPARTLLALKPNYLMDLKNEQATKLLESYIQTQSKIKIIKVASPQSNRLEHLKWHGRILLIKSI